MFLCDGQGAVRQAILSLWQVLFVSYFKSIINKFITINKRLINKHAGMYIVMIETDSQQSANSNILPSI